MFTIRPASPIVQAPIFPDPPPLPPVKSGTQRTGWSFRLTGFMVRTNPTTHAYGRYRWGSAWTQGAIAQYATQEQASQAGQWALYHVRFAGL